MSEFSIIWSRLKGDNNDHVNSFVFAGRVGPVVSRSLGYILIKNDPCLGKRTRQVFSVNTLLK